MQELLQYLLELAHDRAYATITIEMRDGKIDAPITVERKYKMDTLPIRDKSRIGQGAGHRGADKPPAAR